MEGFFFGINYLSHKLFFRTFRQKFFLNFLFRTNIFFPTKIFFGPFVDKLFELKIIWGEEGGGHKAFSSILEGVMKKMTKNIQKRVQNWPNYILKGVKQSFKNFLEGGTLFL